MSAPRMPCKLSIVVPLYNEEAVLDELIRRLRGTLSVLSARFGLAEGETEVIFVNDASTDGTRARLSELCRGGGFRLITLSRNHGHQLALTAGIDAARGDAVVLMDGDLQDPPEFIVDLYARMLEGFDVVYAVRRARRGETWFKRATAAAFYRLFRAVADIDLPRDTGDFRIMRRRVADVLRAMRETHRFVRGMTSWAGFRQTGLEYDRDERHGGVTKYPLLGMIRFSIDAITSFSAVPLRVVSITGFAAAFVGMLLGVWTFYIRLFSDRTVQGWSSLMVMVLFLGGVQLIAVGVIGEYLKRMHDQIKARPLYVVDEVLPPDRPA